MLAQLGRELVSADIHGDPAFSQLHHAGCRAPTELAGSLRLNGEML
jgi:hypothetical protein